MLTESDAKTKACCGGPAISFAILAASTWAGGGEVQLAAGRSDGGLCLGSACMAWRTIPVLFNITLGKEMGEGELYSNTDKVEWKTGPRGYCGLAGTP